MAFTHESGFAVVNPGGGIWDWKALEADALASADALVFDNPDTETFYVTPATRVRQT